MSFKQRPPENTGQNIGCDPNSNSSKRNSGLFSFLKWFKPSTSRESIDTDPQISHSSSCDSLNSSQSDGTVASFSFIAPGDYKNSVSEKYIALGPETDTYKARLKQRDKVREKDKNLTLRKKYNLFFNRDSIKPTKEVNDTIENSKSLPLITRGVIMEPQLEDDNNKVLHRRTNSESSKVRKAGSYVHVKGKRKAPQPPTISKNLQEDTLKRKKRLAPPPPPSPSTKEDSNIISNDSLKLDHGVLKPVKETNIPTNNIIIEPPVSPRAWYKRNEKTKSDVPFTSLDLNVDDVKIEKKKEIEKRKSGMTFLTNISELDREAYEIIKNKDLNEMPEFMRPKNTKVADTEEWISPKRRSAKDLIAKFNAITNVKRSVFGGSHKDKLFEKQISLDETKRRQEFILENHKKRLEEIDNKKNFIPLMKSESASAIKVNKKETTPKMERKCWICPKCNIDNDYWRIICHVCSTIKPYFDDFSSSSSPKENNNNNQPTPSTNINFERSKTQIGFSALLNYNNNKIKPNSSSSDEKEDQSNKRAEEKEKLKKILIEMKNSLPKRNINQRKNNTSSIILENPEDTKNDEEQPQEEPKIEKTQEEKVAEILIGTTQTIYENIKVKKTDNPKPIKVSSSSQTTAAVKQHLPSSTIANLVADQRNKPDFQLMQMKDFENIYSSQSSQSAAKMYANLVRNDELSLFFNIPKDIPKKDEKSTKLTRTDSLQINRLLKKLEMSISKGELQESSIIARELALLKVNCSVVKNKTLVAKDNMKKIQIEMYVEDKISHRGPFPIDVIPEQTLLQLKNQVQKEFDIPVAYQRWILGKELITDDNACLKNHGITKEGCPVFLYLVAPDKPSTSETDLKLLPSTSKETTPPKVTESIKPTNNNKPPKISNLFKDRLETKNNQQQQLNGSNHTPKIVNVIPKVTELLMKPQEILIEKESYKKETTPPIKETTPNTKVATPPKKETSPLTKETTTPIKQTSPKKESTPPIVLTTPIKQTSPKKESTPPIVVTTPIKQASSKQESTPPIVVTTPMKIETTPPIKVTSPPKKETSPPIKVTTPPIKVTPTKQEIPNIAKEVRKTTEKIEIKQTSSSTPIEILRVEIKSTEIPITVESVELKLQNTTDLQKPSTSTPIIFPDPKLEVKPIIQQVFPTLQENLNIPPKAKEEEDFSDYESKTLKPIKEWECHLCTLLNPITSNMCAVCSTIRLRIKTESKKDDKETKEESTSPQTYMQLLNLDNTDLIENSEPFTCLVCFIEIAPNDGVTLRECLHQFCKICLSQTIEFSDEAEVKCPFRDENYACNIGLQDREIKALVSAKVYEQHLAKSVAQAENKIDNSFHCKTPDCKGWCVYEDNVNEFKCPVCRRTNCLTCQAIHIGINCRQWQEKIKDDANLDENGKKTKEMLEEMVKKGEAIECPTCRVILMKKWGCDWLRCSMCKTEICWVTRGPRWGPAGKGDTSGGCKCGVNGIKCHPKCNYCH